MAKKTTAQKETICLLLTALVILNGLASMDLGKEWLAMMAVIFYDVDEPKVANV